MRVKVKTRRDREKEETRNTQVLRLFYLLITVCLFIPGCLEFKSIEQPSSVLPGELFSLLVEVAGDGQDPDSYGSRWYPISGICLPIGWIIPGDTVEFLGAYQGSITYDPNLSLEQEDLSPAPEGYYWWVGRGPWLEAYDPDEVFAEIPIQAGLQPGLYSLEYLLYIGPSHYGLRRAKRTDRYSIEVVDELTPRGLNALTSGNSVVLTWLPPIEKEGLAGYSVYRDGELLNTEPLNDSAYSDQNLPGGVFHYFVSSIYENGDEHIIPYEIMAIAFSGGTGEANTPYQVTLAEQLIALADVPDLLDKYFVLNNDIDLDPDLQGRRVFNKAVISTFSGTFDGHGYTIQHLTIEAELNELGFLGVLESGGQIRNMGITDVNITGSESVVAGLVVRNNGILNSCYVTGAILGNGGVGGLVGTNEPNGQIDYCYSSGIFSGEAGIGGLVGINDGSITSSYSSGLVRGRHSVAGLAASNKGSILTSYSNCSVSGDEWQVGGLVGSNEGKVNASFWDIQSSGQAASAGGAGLTTDEMMDPFIVGLNGLANDPNWVLDAGRDYPRLAWEGTPGVVVPAADTSWLTGQGTADSPYQIDTADQLILLSKAGILWDKHFLLGADVDLNPALSGRQIFRQAVIPLFAGVFDGADHVISNLRIVGTYSHLGLIGTMTSDAEVRNIGLVDVEIDITEYWGTGGLVGINDGSIVSSYSTGTITGHDLPSGLGGLVGYNSGSVTMSFSTITVKGSFDVGGLVGGNDGRIISSYSNGPVNGRISIGGLVGSNEGSVISSYSSGSVVGDKSPWDSVGGLVGSNYGNIAMSYSSGPVSGRTFVGGLVGRNGESVDTSFWDIQSSGWATSAGGTGLTTGEMQTAGTFLSAGWDFIDETSNGSEDIWWIEEGQDYPRLWWEIGDETSP